MKYSFPSFLLAACIGAYLIAPTISRAQASETVQPEAVELLEKAFTYCQSNPIQFISRNEISQRMGEHNNDMVIGQLVTAAKGKIAIVGMTPDYPTPAVYYDDGRVTVVFDREKSYVQIDGIGTFEGVFKNPDLGYDQEMGENSLIASTPGMAFFAKLFGTDAKGRKELISGLKLGEDIAVSGVAGKRLSGTIRANPMGLPIENATVPFELVIAAAEPPLLLGYAPDNSTLIAQFAKTRPQLGPLQVLMQCSFTDWKTGPDVDVSQLALPDLSAYKKFESLEKLAVSVQSEGSQSGGSEPNALVGKPAPEIELDTADGGKFKLSDEAGKNVVVLDFWATWCGPCVKAMPIIDKVTKALAARGVKFVAVNLQETEEQVAAFMKAHGMNPIVAMDRDSSISKKYFVSGIPQTVIVDKEGKVAKVHVGLIPTLEQQLTEELEELTK